MAPLRSHIAGRVRRLVGSGIVDLARPPGDDGLFGPASPAWKVHGDVTGMMVGGLSALMLQMLHPLALAGVWDHSDFRNDRLGRLQRTAQFIALTTFGATASADKAIARVRAIHDRVVGKLPDGTPYSANDPALLTWIHVAEVDSFLRAYLRYAGNPLTLAEQDRYFAETARVARALGARDIPETRHEVEAYYRTIRADLRVDHRTREVIGALLAPGHDTATNAAMSLMTQAAIDLLPPWAATLHGRTLPAPLRPAIRAGTAGMRMMLRWAMARKT